MPFTSENYPKKGDLIRRTDGKAPLLILSVIGSPPEPEKAYGHICKAVVKVLDTDEICFLKFVSTADPDLLHGSSPTDWNYYNLARNAELHITRESRFIHFYPYIMKVFGTVEAEIHGNPIYGVLVEHIKGVDLRTYRRVKPVSLTEEEQEEEVKLFLRQITQFLKALNYLHHLSSSPALHRDIKPLNLMITEAGHDVMLVDFDCSHVARSDETERNHISIGVSYPYADPDTVFSVISDVKSDIYSTGRLLFFWLNGSDYLSFDTYEQLLSQPRSDDSPLFQCLDRCYQPHLRTERFAPLRAIIRRMVAPRNERYQSTFQILEDFRSFLRSAYGVNYEHILGLVDFPLLTAAPETETPLSCSQITYQWEKGPTRSIILPENVITDVVMDDQPILSLYYHGGTVGVLPLTQECRTADGGGWLLNRRFRELICGEHHLRLRSNPLPQNRR